MEGFTQNGYSVIHIPTNERTCNYETQRGSVQGMLKNNPEGVAHYGVFGPEKRAAKGGKLIASPLFTTDALGVQRDGTKVLNDFFHPEQPFEQIPAIMLVKPTVVETRAGTDQTLPYWMFLHSHSSAKVVSGGFTPAAIVALSPVCVHFFPHASAAAAEWEARVQSSKTNTTTLLKVNARTERESDQTNKQDVVTLAQGDVFVTHTGMPIYCSPADGADNFVVQTIAVNVLAPGNKRRSAWVSALSERGLIKQNKFGEVLFYGLVTGSADDLELYPRVATVATEASVPWLTAAPKRKKPAAAPKVAAAPSAPASPAAAAAAAAVAGSPSPAAAAPAAGGAARKRRETVVVDGVEILTALQAQFAAHQALEERIAAIPRDVWDPKLEETVQKHREKLKQQLVTATSKNISSYQTTLGSLATNIKKAEDLIASGSDGEQSKYEVAKAVLDECGTILEEMVIPDGAKKEAISLESCKKAYAAMCTDKSLFFKKDTLDEFLVRCNNLVEAVAARSEGGGGTKRPRSAAAAASTPTTTAVPEAVEVDLDSLEDNLKTGPELGVHLMAAQAKYKTFVEAVEANGREDLLEVIEVFLGEINEAIEVAKAQRGATYNVNRIDAYSAAITAALEAAPIAAAARKRRDVETKSGVVKFAFGKTRIDCASCGEPKYEFADGHCEECFKEGVDERIGVIGEHEDPFRALAADAKEQRLKVSRTNTALTAPELACQKYVELATQIKRLWRKFLSEKNAYGELIAVVEETEELIISTFGHLGDEDDEDVGGGDDEDDGGSSPFGADEDDEVEYDEEEEEEEEEEKKTSKKKRSRDSAEEEEEEEEEEGGASVPKKALLLADRFIRVRRRVPIEKTVNEIHSLYEKGDDASLTAADVAIASLESMKSVWALKVVNGFEYPFVFENEEDAEGKALLLQKKVPGAAFEVYQKNLE